MFRMLIIGHRGARGLAQENTIASFQKAIDYGVDGVEFDVHTTSDNVPVIIHDDQIRFSNHSTKISKLSFRQLSAAVPNLITLDEALGFNLGKCSIVVEIKSGSTVVPIMKSLEENSMSWSLDKIVVSSFDFKILQEIHAAMPKMPLSVNERWSGIRGSMRAKKLNTNSITMNERWLWSGFIRTMSKRGYLISAYTLNDPKKASRFAKAGLHAVITDFPDRYATA